MTKIAIVTTHPIQYYAPWFRLLAERGKCQVKVFYTWSQSKESVQDRTFGKEVKWDIPLLEGYDYEFVENVSKKPGSHHFFGIDCPDLIPKIEKFHPDAILIFGWNFITNLRVLRHFKGKIPVWFRGDSTLLNETGGYKTRLRRIVLKKVYSYVDKAFYVGEQNKAYFIKHNLKQDQLVYAPHAIDNKRFDDNVSNQYEAKALKWKEELGYNAEDIIVLYAGKFESVKQLEFLLEAVLKANENRSKPIKLLMVGSGPLEEKLKGMASGNLNIQFLGFQNQTQMPIVYRLGSIFCLSSKSETWGLAINESMASGKPAIVSSKVGCAKDLITNNKNGYVFTYDKLNELQDILESLSISTLEELGTQAKKDIQSHNFESIVFAIETELSKL